MIRRLLVTGSNGLIGSEVVTSFCREGWEVHGIDNNLRVVFFGPPGDTSWIQARLLAEQRNFTLHELDIRHREAVLALVAAIRPDAIVHTAAQPSHDLAARIPFEDFDINAGGTLNLLEAARRHAPEAPFVHLSTNKVYGDAPNEIPLVETETRFDYADPAYHHGIPESFRIDASTHSLFGASKLAADILVQEYGRYFGLPTVCLRGGCLTGPQHAGVELHGFLSYLSRCHFEHRTYRVYGYKGKQVRDNIHSVDVVEFIRAFIVAPRVAEIYNIGGGRENSISILEAFALLEALSGYPPRYEYIDQPRRGDHICYISDLRKARADYPGWSVTRNLHTTLSEMWEAWTERKRAKT